MKILNLHGFLGASDNKNYKALCGIVPSENIISPKLDYINLLPQELIDFLSEKVNSDDFIFIGQSLGGWYADFLSRKFSRPCILTNPCYFPHELELITSKISEESANQYRLMSADSKNPLAYAVCGDADTLIADNLNRCIQLSQTVTSVHGGHSSIKNLGGVLETALKSIGF